MSNRLAPKDFGNTATTAEQSAVAGEGTEAALDFNEYSSELGDHHEHYLSHCGRQFGPVHESRLG